MTDELKQWEYDKGYTKGYSDGRASLIDELEKIKEKIDIECDSVDSALDVILDRISELKGEQSMKLIIEIPEKTYEQLKFLNEQGFGTVIDELVVNGTPLPKEHGDLIDADRMIKELNERIQTFDEGRNEILKQSDRPEENHQIPLWMWKGCCKTCGIVIEADKEYEE